MKITCTKKLIIIILTLLCAIAVGLGVMFAANSSGHRTLLQESVAEDISDEPSNNEADESEDGEALADFDPAFDEGRLRLISEELEIDYDVVNFYAHAKNIGAEELEAQLYDESLVVPWVEQFYNPETDSFQYTSDDLEAAMAELGVEEEEHDECEEEVLGDDILADRINGFRISYAKGEVLLDSKYEGEDWYISPDELQPYANGVGHWNYCNVNKHGVEFLIPGKGTNNGMQTAAGITWNYNIPAASSSGWGQLHGNSHDIDQPSASGEYQYNLRPSEGGFGQWAEITLAPGEKVRIGNRRYYSHNDGGNSYKCSAGTLTYSGNNANDLDWYYCTFDGDLQDGWIVMFDPSPSIYKWTDWQEYGRFREPSATATCVTSQTTYWSEIYYWELKIKRTPPARPTIVSDDDGGTISGTTKTMTFTGEPAHISFYPDWGSCLLTWTANDPAVQIYDRAIHGAEAKNLTLEVKAAGTYQITLTTPLGQWSDPDTGAISSGPITFTFNLNIATTEKPQLEANKNPDGRLNANRTTLTVNDTGQEQRITITHCDPAYLKWDSNGLIEESWDPVEKVLVLKQSLQNNYSISISIANTAACVWSGGGGTAPVGFSFVIKERLIEKPNIEGLSPGVMDKTVQYDSETQELVLTPILQGSLNMITSLPYEYVQDASVGDSYADHLCKLKYTTVDANTYAIIIYPATGYVWKDVPESEEKAEYTYTFKIETIKVGRPTLVDTANVQNGTKTVTYDPYGGKQSMTIRFKDELEAAGIDVITAMTLARSETTGSGYECVYEATSANTYPINFVPKTNYEWASGVSAPMYTLVIQRKQLQTPAIVQDSDPKGEIDQNTKTVQYVEGDYEHQYIKIKLGTIFTSLNDLSPEDWAKQVKITEQQSTIPTSFSQDIYMEWESQDTDTPTLVLKAQNAKNYQIEIAPTENYMWTDGTFEQKLFKLVVSPILRDNVSLQVQSTENGYTVLTSSEHVFTYDGTEKGFKVGVADMENAHYDSDTMTCAVVDNTDPDNVTVISNLFNENAVVNKAGCDPQINSHKFNNGETDYCKLTVQFLGNGEILFKATEANTYVIRVQLKNTNYAWRDGSGVDLYFTITIKAQAIEAPRIIPDECGGGGSGKPFVTDDTLFGTYDGGQFTMAISLQYVGTFGEEVLQNMFDLRMSEGMERSGWSEDLTYGRLSVVATEQGIHELTIGIKDTNFCWASDLIDYTFYIKIDFAIVGGVTFYAEQKYEQNGSIVTGSEWSGGDGSSYSTSYITDEEQRVTIRRTNQDEFQNTEYQTQFEITVDAYNQDGVHDLYRIEWNGIEDVSLYFKHANTYYINVAPTSNFSWAGGVRSPMTFTLVISPKQVAIPDIYDYQDGSAIIGAYARKTTYNRAQQQLKVVLGTDYKAYEVIDYDDMILDATELSPDVFAYLATDAGTHHLRVGLADTYNYTWSGGVEQDYRLIIEKLAVDVPDVYIHTDDDYVNAKTAGQQISTNTQNAYTTSYTGKPYFVFFYGEVVEKKSTTNTDVEFEYTFSDPDNTEGTVGDYLASNGAYVAWRFQAAKVNEYTVTVKFPDGTSNLYWRGTQENTDPREFKIKIVKKLVDLPEIDAGRPDQTLTTMENDSVYADFTYNHGHRTIYITNYISTYGLMTASYDGALAKGEYKDPYYEFTTDVGAGGNDAAYVGWTYCLTLSIDYKNEAWNITDDPVLGNYSDTDKMYYIRINPLSVALPTIKNDISDTTLHHNQTATLTDFEKAVVYDGTAWSNVLTIEGLDSQNMTYTLATPATMSGVYTDTAKTLVVSTNAPSFDYTVVVSLKDPVNLCWAQSLTSADLNFVFKVTPITIDKVFVDQSQDTDVSTTRNPVFTDTSKTVTYDSNSYDIWVYNYLDTAATYHEQLNYEVISTHKFENSSIVASTVQGAAAGVSWLKLTATGAGEYTVRFTLSQNAQWDDGSRDPIDITLDIEKLQYKTPFVLPYDYPADPSTDTTVVDSFTRVVTYKLDASGSAVYQSFDIGEYDPSIMTLYARTSTSDEEIVLGTPTTNTYPFTARLAGTYTVTFAITDFANNRWEYDDRETVTLTFIIEKLKLEIPVIDGDYLQASENITLNGTRLVSSFNNQKHTALIENVLDSHYMTYADTTTYPVSDVKHQRTLSNTIVANNYLDGVSAAGGYKPNTTVNDVFGYNGDTTVQFAGTTTLTTQVDKLNYILFSATNTGTYTVAFNIAADQLANIVWADDTQDEKVLTIVVNKYSHAAPQVVGGYSKVYTGDYVNFRVDNVYNGQPTGTEYEVVSIDSTNTALVAGAALEIDSWASGTLTLKAKEVGTYYVNISVKDAELTQWSSGATSVRYSFTVEKRPLTASVQFVDVNTNTPVTTWAVKDEVKALVTINNIANVGSAAAPMADISNLAANIYFTAQGSTEQHADANNRSHFSTDDIKGATLVLQSDGTYSATLEFPIPHGEGKINKGLYTLHVEQYGEANNYELASSDTGFEIGPESAPFDIQNLVWEYTIDNDPAKTVHTLNYAAWSATSQTQPLTIPYLTDGGKYEFKANLDAVGMQGYDNKGYTDWELALVSWKVQFVKYDGDKISCYAGAYKISVVLTSSDPETYAFPQQSFSLWYTITPAVYDLSQIKWDYDPVNNSAANPFTFDNTAKAVKLTGMFPTGLTVLSYQTGTYDLNTQIYAGTYTTSLVFTTSNSNYITPDRTDPATYIYNDPAGVNTDFPWECNWIIQKAYLDVDWREKQASDGTSVAYVPILDSNDEKVDYLYEIEDLTSPTGWTVVTSFSKSGINKYRVTATLKTSTEPSINYANNYILRTVHLNDNPHEFYLDGSSNVIAVNIKVSNPNTATYSISLDPSDPTGVNSTMHSAPDFKYNGDAYTAVPEITVPASLTSLGLTAANNILVTYYSTANDKRPIPAPTEPGSYIVKVALVNISSSSSTPCSLADTQFYFDIAKGDFDLSKVYWQYTHEDSATGNTYVAVWDKATSRWIDNTAHTPITSFVYDGNAHTVELVSDDPNLTVLSTKDKAQIHAGTYKSSALLSYDSNRWNAPDVTDPTFSVDFNWTVDKQVLDMSFLIWDYKDFDYTISGGEAKSVHIGTDISVKNIPAALLTNIYYITYDTSTSTKLESSNISQVGTYQTQIEINEFAQDSDYTINVSTFPAGFTTTTTSDGKTVYTSSCNWQIKKRVLPIPVSNHTWDVFDGSQHDLRDILNFGVDDWSEYYTLTIKVDGLEYDGTTTYGFKYTAYDADTYEYTFTLKDELKDGLNVWWTGSTTNDQTATIVVQKATITVTGWDPYMYASKVFIGGTYVTTVGDTLARRAIGYKYFKRTTGSSATGNVPDTNSPVELKAVLSSSNETFFITPYILDAYKDNITLDYVSQSTDEYYEFTTPDLANEAMFRQVAVSGRPYIVGYIAGGEYHEFTLDEWKEFCGITDEYWKSYLETNGEELRERKASAESGLTPVDPEVPEDPADGDSTGDSAGDSGESGDEISEEDWNLLFYAYELLTTHTVYVTYDGNPVTFVVYNWDTQYVNYLTPWGGDNLTQSAAGTYSITYMFNHNLNNTGSGDGVAYYWSRTETVPGSGEYTYDRSEVTLSFQIKYLMLNAPSYDEEAKYKLSDVTYNEGEISILEESLGTELYAELVAEYGDYVEITGDKATDAGKYTMHLTIKPEYQDTVRWANDSEFGQPGTFDVQWTILPINLFKPVIDNSLKIVYDGAEHTVYEVLRSYTVEGGMSEELIELRDKAIVSAEGSHGVNAGNYTAVFKLPSSNYAWIDQSGTVDAITQTISIQWTISKKTLDMSQVAWNYDENNPFKYTYENGAEKAFTIELEGLPTELLSYVSYMTYVNGSSDGYENHTYSRVGEYRTVLYLSKENPELLANYDLGSLNGDFESKYHSDLGYLEISWKIAKRAYNVTSSGNWEVDKEFDGNVHDLMVLLGFEEDWVNYFDVEVTYSGDGDGTKNYDPTTDPVVDYSIYNVFYVGTYQVNIKIKSEVNGNGDNNVVWIIGGNENTGEQSLTLEYGVRHIEVTEWQQTADLYEIQSLDYDNLPEETKAMFGYYIYDYDEYQSTGVKTYLTKEQIAERGTGYNYCVEFRLKDEYNTYAYTHGFEIEFASGVDNPHMFGNHDYGDPTSGGQPIKWIPLPHLDNTSETFTAQDIEFAVHDWSTNYAIDTDFVTTFNAANYTDSQGNVFQLDPSTVSLVYSIGETELDTATGIVKVKAAGKYTVTLKLDPNINLSWYDPAIYTVDETTGNLKELSSGNILSATADYENLIDRYAKVLNFEVTKASLRESNLELDSIEGVPEIEYNGTRQDIASRGQVKTVIDGIIQKYGDLVTIEGNIAENVGEYTLYIKLTDPESSYWDLGNTTYNEVTDPDYKLSWINEEGTWKVKLVLVDGDGDIVYDADGNYTEYNGGAYLLENPDDKSQGIKYKFKYKVNSYVPIFEELEEEDGVKKAFRVNESTDYETTYAVLVDGVYVLRKFEVDENGKLVKNDDGTDYKYTEADYSYVFANEDGVLTKYKLDGNTFTEDENGTILGLYQLNADGTLFESGYLMENGHRVIDYANSKVFVEERSTHTNPYTITWKIIPVSIAAPTLNLNFYSIGEGDDALIDENGKPKELGYMLNDDGTAKRYAREDDNYVEAADGEYVAMPAVRIEFSGSAINIAEVPGALKGFDPSIMEIVEHGTETLAGTYTAVIKLTTDNYYWRDAEDSETVTVVWTITQGVLDLSGVTWSYSWNEADGFPTYTVENGVATVYYVKLAGVPDYLQQNIVYTTNGKEGAYAGRAAGKYVTSFKFININEQNYVDIIYPELEPVTWYINKRKLDMPETNQTWFVFDNGVHDLLDMLKLPENWEEYLDITVLYSSNNLVFEEYLGYDDGTGLKWNLAYGAGAYQFRIAIKSSINKDPANPSVVWLKESSDDNEQTPEPETFMLTLLPYEESEDERLDEELLEDELEEELEELLEQEEYIEEPSIELYEEETAGDPEGDPEGNKPGEGEIADPTPDDREDLDEWTDRIVQLTGEVSKITVKGLRWTGTESTSTLVFDYDPLHLGLDTEQVKNILDHILLYEVVDKDRNVMFTSDNRDITKLRAGCTYYVHPLIREGYENNIEIQFAEGVLKAYDFWLMEGNASDYTEIPLPTDLFLGSQEFTGEEISYVLEILEQYPCLQIVEAFSDSLTQKDAKVYHIMVGFRDGTKYCWSKEGGVIDRHCIQYTFEITAKEITVSSTVLESLKYTGEEIDITEALKELVGEETLEYLNIIGNTVRENAGSYEVLLSVKNEYYGNVVWGDGVTVNSDGTVSVHWEIGKAKIGGTWNEVGQLNLQSDSYKGGSEGKIKYTYKDVETGAEVEFSAMVKGRTYEVVAELLDTDNLEWTEGFETTHRFLLNVDIIVLPKPRLTNQVKSYTGQEITFEIENYLTQYADYIDIVDGSLTQTEIGDYTVTIRIKNAGTAWDSNSTDDVILNFSITRAVLSGSWIEGAGKLNLTSSYRYSYEGKVGYTYSQNGVIVAEDALVEGETYQVTAEILDTEHFEWASGMKLTTEFTYTNKTVVIEGYPEVEQDTFTYSGQVITPVIKNWQYFSQYVTISSNVVIQNAGTYELKLTISDPLAKWEDGTRRDIIITITINKLVLELDSWKDNGTVAFKNNGYVGSYDGVVAYTYYLADGTTRVEQSELQDGQEYVVTVSLVDGQNFEFGEFEKTHRFMYKATGGAGGSAAFPGWAYILVGVVAFLLLVILIFIIVVMVKRRKSGEDEDQPEESEQQTEPSDEGEYDYNEDEYDDYNPEDYDPDSYSVEGYDDPTPDSGDDLPEE